MRLVSLENITPEHRLAKNIYDENGNILLANGNNLKQAYIERFKKMGIIAVYVEDDEVEPLEVEDVVSEGIRVQVKKITKEALLKVKSGHSLEAKKIREAINDIMDEVIRNRHMLVHLTEIRSNSDVLFSHAVNVCILSLLTGVAMGYNQLKLKELGVGALLHDVGKAPSEKEGSGEQVQKHTTLGFEILRKTENIGPLAAHVAWQHHEHFDGTGFPRGLKGQDIHEYARIVAVANLYDNLSTDTLSRTRMLPHEAVETVQACQGKELDPEIVKMFIQNIAPYPVGSRVVLNTGARGVVVEVEKQLATRPKVKLLVDDKGNQMNEPIVLDLLKELSVFVSEVERE